MTSPIGGRGSDAEPLNAGEVFAHGTVADSPVALAD